MKSLAVIAPLALATALPGVAGANPGPVPPPGAELPITISVERAGTEAERDMAATHRPGSVRRLIVSVHNATVSQLDGVALLLKAENAEIVAAGQHGTTEAETRVLLAPLLPGATQTIDVAVMLSGTPADAARTGFASLEARAEAGLWVSWQSAGWRVGDCAAAYHAALGTLHQRLPQFDRAVDNARAADKSLPGRFLFKPAQGGSREEAAALRVAGTLASRRGADPFLAAKDTRWYLGQIYRDLEEYTGQPANPMICTGARDVADFLGKYADRVVKYADGIEGHAETLRLAAAAAIADTWATLGAAGPVPDLAGTAAIPGVIDRMIIAAGGAAVAAPQVPSATRPEAPADLGPAAAGSEAKAAAGDGAVVIDGDHPLPRRNPDPGTFPVFAKARAALADDGGIGSADARRRIASAIGAIESYFYLAEGAARAGAVRASLSDNIGGIVAAHDELCRCVD